MTGKESGLDGVVSKLQQIKTLVNQINRTSVNVRGNVRVPVVSNNANRNYISGSGSNNGLTTSGNRSFAGNGNRLQDMSSYERLAYVVNKGAQFSRSPASGMQAIGNVLADLSEVDGALGSISKATGVVGLGFLTILETTKTLVSVLGSVGEGLIALLKPRIYI